MVTWTTGGSATDSETELSIPDAENQEAHSHEFDVLVTVTYR